MGALPRPVATSLLRCLFLGLSALVVPAQLKVNVQTGFKELQVVEGSEVVLPAWYSEETWSQPLEVLSAIWYLQQYEKEPEQVLAYIRGATVHKDRVSLVYSMPARNVSLRLQALEEKDSGFYYCSVNLQDRHGQRTEHAQSQLMELSVLVPPAPPSCRVVGVPLEGSNVSLSCKSPRSKPAAQYQWTRAPPSSQVFFPPVLDTYRGFLNLSNLSLSMSGVYMCKVHNQVGSSSCNVTLEVSTGLAHAVVAGAIVGTVLGLALLAGLVLLFLRRRQTKGVEEAANDIKEDATAPRTLLWPKGSDTISKNGTLSSVTSARALRSPTGPARPGTGTPTPSLSSQALSSPRLPGTIGAHRQPPTPSPGSISSSMLSRMGAVPVMVPSKDQSGSLV